MPLSPRRLSPALPVCLRRSGGVPVAAASLVIAVCGAVGGAGAPVQAAAAEPGSAAPRQALFRTRAEAEAAAKQFNCSGAHQMGQQWMPCASHGQAGGSHHQH